ncbi:MAG: signal recognition particle protein [Synergistales bacterium]|nr:signal recognition particle protein [Synergistales bacterium]
MFDSLKDRLEGVFKGLRGKGKLTEQDVGEALREVRRALLEADVNYKLVKDLVGRIRERAVGREVLDSITPAQQVISIVYEELTNLMGSEHATLQVSPKPPTTYMLVGLQGSGKTTSCAKLAARMSKGHKPLLVACDLQRPAAVEQLRTLAEKGGFGFFGPDEGESDPVPLVKRSLRYAADHLYDVVILDTAGRLHVDEELMAQLRQMKRKLQPTETLLVLDAMTGQEAVQVAEHFHSDMELTGLVLSKLDGDARGGAALAVRSVTGVPVKLAGVGEGIKDYETFDPQRMAGRIMGMGDVEGLMEKVRDATDQKDATKLAESIKKDRFTLEDLLSQLEQLEKMGPLNKVMEMLPMGGQMKQLQNAEVDPQRLKRIRAVIQSMTPRERRKPEIIKGSRRRRIANGSGTSVQMVNQVLKQYNQMRGMMKKFGKGAKKGKLPKNMMPF